MSVHSLPRATAPEPVHQAKVHLAASLRMAVQDELEEGIDNHFSLAVPGSDELFLLNRYFRATGQAVEAAGGSVASQSAGQRSGATSLSGVSTNRRSLMRGCGTVRRSLAMCTSS